MAVLTGDPTDVILEQLAERRADLVVMRTRGRGGLARACWAVAEGIVSRSPSPVLLRPRKHPRPPHYAPSSCRSTAHRAVRSRSGWRTARAEDWCETLLAASRRPRVDVLRACIRGPDAAVPRSALGRGRHEWCSSVRRVAGEPHFRRGTAVRRRGPDGGCSRGRRLSAARTNSTPTSSS